MDVVVYKAKGKNGYLYDMSFNPYVDFEILKNTRNISGIEVLTPRISMENGEAILNRIYSRSFFRKIVLAHDRFIKHGLKKLKIDEINNRITIGLKVPPAENIALIEECIKGKVITIKKLLQFKDVLGFSEEDILNIIQLLYCERRIRMVPAMRKKKSKRICSFCEKDACGDCCLGFTSEDILLYAADNYNMGTPRSINYKKKKLSDSLNRAFEGINQFAASGKKNQATLWSVPGGFDYVILAEALAKVIMSGGKVLYITSGSALHEAHQELSNIIDGISVSIVSSNNLIIKDSDMVICSYNDYPCFHKAFDFVVYDERMSYFERPLKNMLSISRRAVKEKGKLLNITCFPEIKKNGHGPELITIPVTSIRAPIPEPLIVSSRLLKEGLPQIIIDTIKWSVEDNLKIIIFSPRDEMGVNIYNFIINSTDIKKELIDFSTVKDKTSIMKLKRKEIQILISSDIKDANTVVEDLNVLVMYADDGLYTKEALMYMASMADFHTKKKCGQVIFAVEKESDDVINTKDRIRGINKIAWENGFLKK